MKQELIRLVKAAGYSMAGIMAALRHEPGFILECVVSVILIPIAIFSSVALLGKLLMIGSLLLILIIELINSAIEATVDRISLEKHELAKRAKDMASAAVLVGVINATVIWTALLWPFK